MNELSKVFKKYFKVKRKYILSGYCAHSKIRYSITFDPLFVSKKDDEKVAQIIKIIEKIAEKHQNRGVYDYWIIQLCDINNLYDLLYFKGSNVCKFKQAKIRGNKVSESV